MKIVPRIFDVLEISIRLYRTDDALKALNLVRRDLFATKGRPLKNLPPPADALKLKQHILRAAYQAGYIWSQGDIIINNFELPPPIEWNWQKDGKYLTQTGRANIDFGSLSRDSKVQL